MKQQIADCVKETIGQYYWFEQEEMEDIVEKMYNIFHANKQEEKHKHKRKTSFSIITLNTMNKNDQHMNVQILVY